jgi:hypothetical protein
LELRVFFLEAMAVDFSDTLSLDDFWRQAGGGSARYSADATEENHTELQRALRLFADLVVRGQMPKPFE